MSDQYPYQIKEDFAAPNQGGAGSGGKKSRRKTVLVVVIVLVVLVTVSIIAFILLNGDSGFFTTTTTTTTTSKAVEVFDYRKHFPVIDPETGISVDKVSNKKNKDIEMQINHDGYTEEELLDLISHTLVRIFNVNPNDSNRNICYCGNVYDIDDDYVYILTCEHAFSETQDNVIRSMFFAYNDARIKPQNYKIELSPNMDIALITIDKNEIPAEILDNLKSINISESYTFDATKEVWYSYGYNFVTKEYLSIKFYTEWKYNGPYIINDDELIHGFSGSCLFDKYGRFLGVTSNGLHFAYYNIPREIYNLIKS